MITLMTIIAIVGVLFLGIGLTINLTADNTDAKAMAVLPFMFGLGIFAIDGVLVILHAIL